mmetsp:Transcript_16258/g.32973  ORF Transcript_16258/g.32973 Transcript_16258/m.32973 type:complete len:149 (+) Transcript_16258:1491-1937(+)
MVMSNQPKRHMLPYEGELLMAEAWKRRFRPNTVLKRQPFLTSDPIRPLRSLMKLPLWPPYVESSKSAKVDGLESAPLRFRGRPLLRFGGEDGPGDPGVESLLSEPFPLEPRGIRCVGCLGYRTLSGHSSEEDEREFDLVEEDLLLDEN